MSKHRSYKSSEKTIIQTIKKEHEHICYYCKKLITNQTDLTVDHKEPYDGANTTYENCVITCSKCNGEKNCMNELEYHNYLSFKSEMSKLPKNKLKDRLDKIISLLRSREVDNIALGRKARALKILIKN